MERTQEQIKRAQELVVNVTGQLERLSDKGVRDEMSAQKYKVLSVVKKYGPASIGMITQKVGTAQSTTSDMVHRLMKAGLVQKKRSKTDERVVMVELSDEGRDKFTVSKKKVQLAYRRLFERLSLEEQSSFLGSLRSLEEMLR